ncbi:potassium channel family protein [Sporobolomyces salmoneus]|uniref:potassium channel family protein n=1 Tax=Sporobolomyces salmoneus TaxID=183962 RepID=UPI00316D51DE
MHGPQPQHYRTKSEIRRNHGKVKWQKHRTFSLVAQMLAPLSTLFCIPALSEHWYIRTGPGGVIVESRPDPPLIIAAGAILLVLSVFSNFSILLRLLDTHCRLFTFSTLSILLIHIILALVTVTIFAVQHAHPDGYSLSTAFWLTVVSASIELSIGVSLLIDGFRSRWYSRGGNGLTGEQRSLVLVFNFFVLQLIIGAICYRYLLVDASFVDAIYFVTQNVLTVGFGDVLPYSAGARAFTIVFLTFGIVNYAILLAFVRSTALEAAKERYKARERRTLERIKTRHSTILTHHSKWTAFFIYLTCGLYHPKHEEDSEESPSSSENRSVTSDSETRSTHKEKRSNRRKKKRYAYEEKIEQLNRDQRVEFRAQLVVAMIGVLLTWLLGALIFTRLEGWSYWIAFYFCYISSSSLGLGDFSPGSQAGRAFWCVWALVAAGFLTIFFSILADEYSQLNKETFSRNIVGRFYKPKGKLGDQPPDRLRPSPRRQLSRRSETTSTSVSRDIKNGAHIELVEKGTLEEQEEIGPEAKKEKVNELLKGIRLHLQHLATRDSSDTGVVDTVVRNIMDEDSFKIRNRELVEQDKGLKEFIYLRNLLSAFDELETLLQDENVTEAKDTSSMSHQAEHTLDPGHANDEKT